MRTSTAGCGLLAERLQLDPGVTVDDGTSLLDLGLDSAALLSVVIGIEETFGIDVPDREITIDNFGSLLGRCAATSPAGAHRAGERPSTVAAMFASTVERVGDRLALVDGPERRTWDELVGDVHRLAGTWIAPGDGVRSCSATTAPS